MRKTGFLTATDRENLRIKKFIFHVILREEAEPLFLKKVDLKPEQQDFFKNRLDDAARGHEFVFRAEEGLVHSWCRQILDNPDEHFLENSRKMAAHFKKLHTNNANDGAFIVAQVTAGEREMIFMLKTDNMKVYPYEIRDEEAFLEEVQRSFVEDKNAIQKSAIVDLNGDRDWHIVAFDAKAGQGRDIGDYFRNFLDVEEAPTALALTKGVMGVLREWHQDKKDDLGLPQSFSLFKNKAIEYLEHAQEYREEEFLNAVALTIEGEKRDESMVSLQIHLEEQALGSIRFRPEPEFFDKNKKKHYLETVEGVQIIWSGEAAEKRVSIPDERDKDGLYHIVIRTENIATQR